MSKQDRTYEIAGTSFNQRVMTYRFADGKISLRTGVLRRCGHSDIEFHQLPYPMTKLQAIAWLVANGHSRNAVLPHGHRLTKNPKKQREDVQAAPVKTAEELAAEAAAAEAAAAEAAAAEAAAAEAAAAEAAAAAKLAIKRARDAARKRAARAAARAAKEALVAEAA